MSMFPHTVTLYNTDTVFNTATGEETFSHNITILRGVLYDASKAVNVRTSGLDSADAVNLYIPFSVDATDGITGKKKKYVTNYEFERTEDKSEIWTLHPGNRTFVVKGEAVEPEKNYDFITIKYGEVHNVTKVDMKDFGGLQHWEVGCN